MFEFDDHDYACPVSVIAKTKLPMEIVKGGSCDGKKPAKRHKPEAKNPKSAPSKAKPAKRHKPEPQSEAKTRPGNLLEGPCHELFLLLLISTVIAFACGDREASWHHSKQKER